MSSSAQTIFQYRAEIEALIDDGYSEEEALAILGPGPVAIWTNERILAALREWVWRHSRLPKSTDWTKAADDRPTATTVIARFGTWRRALFVAGLEPEPAPAPEPVRLAEPEPDGDVVIPPMPKGYQPDWGQNGAHEGTRGPGGPTKTPGHNAKAITTTLERVAESERRSQARPVTGRNSRPAPRIAPGRVALSFGATLERLAKQMAFRRGLKWYEMKPKQQDAFYALAEFALDCLREVEQKMDEIKASPREINDELWADVPERRG